MKRIFISHILPPHLIQKHRLSMAACNFSYNLMSGNLFDATFSNLGTYVGGKLEHEAYEDKRFKLFYNTFFRNKGRLGIITASFVEQWQMFRNIPCGASVWLYNVTTINAFLYFLLRFFKPSVQVNVIELDFTPVDRGIGLNQLFLWIINHCHGNIRLAYSSLFTNHRSKTLPGVVPKGAGDEQKIGKTNNKFLLSGVLNDQISQIKMVLKAFACLPQCELHITGKTDDEMLVKKYSDSYPNITWHGNLSFSEYLDVMHSCTFQLSTRDPNAPENQCNFPSKVIETLLHNRIIISTIEYRQIDGIRYFKVDSELEKFVEQIKEISSLPESSLMQYANQGKQVIEMFNTDVWNATMEKIEKQL